MSPLPGIERLGWVLVHSGWQFAALAFVAGVVMRALRQRSAEARYGALVSILAMTAIAPVASWCLVSPGDDPVSAGARRAGGDVDLSFTGIAPTVSSNGDNNGPLLLPDASSGVISRLPAADSPDAASHNSNPLENPPPWTGLIVVAVRPWLSHLVACWMIGVTVCAIRPLAGWLMLWRLKRVGTSPVSTAVQLALVRISTRLEMTRLVRVMQSTLTHAPLLVGYLRPVILLPVSLIAHLPMNQLEAILAHELAHVRRHDFIVNLLQTLIETLFFYHPAVWWISRRIRLEREHCCDDLVVSAFNNRVDYGRALLAVEELRGRTTILALGAADGVLLARIRRIAGLGLDPAGRAFLDRWSPLLFCAACLGAMAVVGLDLWQSAEDRNQKELSDSQDTSEVLPAKEGDPSYAETAKESLPLEGKPIEPGHPVVSQLPGGISVELVGMTKNIAPANEGWRPDGLPMGDVGDWPSSIVLHGKGMNSSAYLEGTAHPEPDENAIDLLFRFRGLKSQPSITFDLPMNGSSYHHLPLKDPWQIRVSSRKRGDPPPGGRWTTPDGFIRVGLTDEPWGRYVRISPEGVVLNPITPDEVYSSTYQLIQVLGTKPYERAPSGSTISIREPVGNTDPDNSFHRYAFEFRAVDTEGTAHWALAWSSRGPDPTRPEAQGWSESLYGLAQPLPDGKMLSHYEYRLRPYRHWVAFENVAMSPDEKATVRVSVAAAPRSDAEILTERFLAALRGQQIPWLNDTMQQDLAQTLRRSAAASIKQPLTPERREQLADAVAANVRRDFNPSEKDRLYLDFQDRFQSLLWSLGVVLARPELTPEQLAKRETQREWMRAEVAKLPEVHGSGVTHKKEFEKLRTLFDDPLNPFVNEPMRDPEFEKFRQGYAEGMERKSSLGTRLGLAASYLFGAACNARMSRLMTEAPMSHKWGGIDNLRWSLRVTPREGNMSLAIGDRQRSRHGIYLDTVTMNYVPAEAPADLALHAAWLEGQGLGDLAFDGTTESFVAVRGAKLARLDATDWFAADQARLGELRTLLERSGRESVPISDYVHTGEVGLLEVRPDAPSIALQTKEGRICVIRVLSFHGNPVFMSRPRPLSPNPPLHHGDMADEPGVGSKVKMSRILPPAVHSAHEERILSRLANPTEVHFVEVSLSDAFQYLSEYSQVPVRLDTDSLKAAEISVETPVTMMDKQGSFQRILNLLTVRNGITWYVDGKEILVTTPDAAVRALNARLEARLELELQIIDFVCGLTEAQRGKVHFAARGNFVKLTKELDGRAKNVLRAGDNEQLANDAFDKMEQLQNQILTNPFRDASYFTKAVETTLTPEQMIKYAPVRAVLQAGGVVGSLRKGEETLLGAVLIGTKISDRDLSQLKGFSAVEVLRLDATEIGDDGVVHLKDLTNLRELYLPQTRVTDQCLVHLKGLQNLTVLDVSGNNAITDAGIADLKRALPNLEVKR